MSKHTTLPYMDAEPFVNDTIDQYRLFCELCEYRTPLGTFYTCEMDAADHLDAAHPKERAKCERLHP